jgi:CO dehydrogenase maturation factor
MKAFYVFSGQGAQFAGMGKDLAENSAAAKRIFETADQVLGYSLSDIIFNGPDEKLTQTIYCQPAIYTMSCAALEAFREAEACSGIDANRGGHDPMKLILCGKGGSGKSTLATLLARACAARGKQVLVIDSDESNFGLHKQLGMELPADFTHYFGHKKGIFQDGAQDVFEGGWHLEDLPEGYYSQSGNVRLMAIGKIAEAGEGCACAMGVLAKTFLEHLILRDDEVVIVDTEAGVEHFGRGVDKYADAILMVADPSYESIQLSGKICEMGESFSKPVYIVLNRVTDQQFDWMKAHMPNPDAVIAGVPMDYDVFLAGMKGERIEKELPGIAEILEKMPHS